MRGLIRDIKKTVVFLGRAAENRGVQLYATGFLVTVQNIFHLVTAKHVVVDRGTGKVVDNDMRVFFNLKSGKIGSRSIKEIKEKFKVDWVFHENPVVDIAVIPFELDPQNDDVKTIPERLFLTIDDLFVLYDVFFLSYQPGIQSQERISPIIRTGTVSLINDDRTFYIDGFAFPGNSGSPVFLKPSPIKFEENGFSIGWNELGGRFVGIIGESITYQEVAVSTQTGRARVVFEENTGLSKVWSVAFIQEIIESRAFKDQLSRLMKG